MTSKNKSNSTFVLSVTALTTLFNALGNHWWGDYQTIVSVSTPITAAILSYPITWGLSCLPTIHSFEIATKAKEKRKEISELKKEIEDINELIKSTECFTNEAIKTIKKNLSDKAIKLTSLQDES